MKKRQTSNGHTTTNGFAPRTTGTTKLLVSFTNVEGSKHYFFSSSLGGGEVARLCTLPGCDKGTHSNPCTCYVSDPLNGVLCFSNGREVYVLNPATADILTLPKSGLESTVEGYVKRDSFNLPYSVYAFGFDPSKQEYKVLHVFGIRHGPGSALLYNQQCEIFTVRIKKDDDEKLKEEVKKEAVKPKDKNGGDQSDVAGDVWRKAVSLPPCPYMFRSQGVCVDGSIYWIGISSPSEEVIVCFDLESEKFRFIQIPFTLPYRSSLSQIRGRLAIQGIEETPGFAPGSVTPTLGVWILEDVKEMKWNKNTADIINPKHQQGVKFHVLVGDDSTGDMVVMRSVLSERYEVVCLSGNKKTAAERTIRIGGFPSWVDLQRGKNLNFRIDNYVESRVPLDPIVVKVEEEKEPEEVKEDAPPAASKAPQAAPAANPSSKQSQNGRAQPPKQAGGVAPKARVPRRQPQAAA